MCGAEAVQHVMHVGMRLSADGDGVVQRVQRSARAERIDSYEGVPGSNATTARDLGLTSGVGAPIITEGRVWGAITVLGSGPPLPAERRRRASRCSPKLVATAIANAQARANLAALADEQAALRRVAELVARGAASREVFAAVATEASQLLGDQAMTLTRFEGERELVVVATAGGPAHGRRADRASSPRRSPTGCGATIASCASTTTPANATRARGRLSAWRRPSRRRSPSRPRCGGC